MLTSESKTKGINMKLSKIIITGLAVVSCGCLVQSVNAIPTLTLSDGINPPIVVTDGSALDSNTLAGAVTFNGSLGVFILNVSTGLTKPLAGSAAAPAIDLNSVNFATAPGTLTITFSETGFTAFPGILTGDVGGTVGAGGSLTNIVMQNALNLVTNGPFGGPGAFSGSGSAALIDGAPYSLTQSAILTFGQAGMISFDAAATVAPVPDGGTTVTMLGIGLLAVGAARRIYRRATV
jgi:VPDSG-CTERM motif